jgi:hypothetical protein
LWRSKELGSGSRNPDEKKDESGRGRGEKSGEDGSRLQRRMEEGGIGNWRLGGGGPGDGAGGESEPGRGRRTGAEGKEQVGRSKGVRGGGERREEGGKGGYKGK